MVNIIIHSQERNWLLSEGWSYFLFCFTYDVEKRAAPGFSSTKFPVRTERNSISLNEQFKKEYVFLAGFSI